MLRFLGISLTIHGVVFFFLLSVSTSASDKRVPLVIGEIFTIDSKILNETRRINVYLPPGYAQSKDMRLPVLYMPDVHFR
jgi:uncharacterized protein